MDFVPFTDRLYVLFLGRWVGLSLPALSLGLSWRDIEDYTVLVVAIRHGSCLIVEVSQGKWRRKLIPSLQLRTEYVGLVFFIPSMNTPFPKTLNSRVLPSRLTVIGTCLKGTSSSIAI